MSKDTMPITFQSPSLIVKLIASNVNTVGLLSFQAKPNAAT